MNIPHFPSTVAARLAAVILAYSALPSASAANQYWSGTGTWNTANTNWGAASGGPYNAAWTSGNVAVFEGTAGTVTMAATLPTVAGVVFNTSGYTVQTSTLTVGASGIRANEDATINSALVLSSTQTGAIAAGRTLTLGGNLSTALANGALSLGTTGTVRISAATVAFTQSANNTSLTLPLIDLNGNTFNIAKRGGSSSVGATCSIAGLTGSGTLGFTSDNNGTVLGIITLNGNNTGFTGTINLNPNQAAHVFNIGSANALGNTASTLTIGSAVTIDAAAGAGTLSATVAQNWNADWTFKGSNPLNMGSGAVTLGGGSRIVTVAASTLTIDGIIGDGGGTFALTKAGPGTLTLSGANTYTGNTTVSAGTLKLGTATTIAASPVIAVTPGATLDVATAGLTLGTAQTLSAGRSAAPATDVNGSITSSGTLSPSGAGTVGTLSINGDLTLSGGSVAVDLGLGLTADNISLNGVGSVSVPGPVVINVSGAGAAIPGTYTLISNSTTATIPTANLTVTGTALTPTWDTSTPGTLKLVLSAASANLTWNGTAAPGNVWNTSGANTPWRNGALPAPFADGDQVTFDGTAATNDVNLAAIVSPVTLVVSGANTVTFSGSGAIAGGTGLTKSGSGEVILNTANTFTGGTFINDGTVTLGHATNALEDTSPIEITAPTATLAIGSNSDTVGAVTLTDGTITGGSGVLSGSSFIVKAGAISASLGGTGALTKTTPGTVALSGASSFTGGTTINAGTLRLGGSTDTLPDAGPVVVDGAAAVLDLGINSDMVGTVTLRNGAAITGTGGTLTGTSYAVESGTVSAILGGSGTLAKTTSGTVTLSGANTFSGGSTLSAGTLLLGSDSALGTGTATLTSGTLAATGAARTVSSPVTINGNLTSLGGATVAVSKLTLSGTVTLSGTTRWETNASVNYAQNLEISGQITGTGGLTRSAGTGSVTLSGPNDFSGGLTWAAGNVASLFLASNTALGTGTFTQNGGSANIGTGAADVVNTGNNAIALNQNFTFVGPRSLHLGTGAVTINAARTITVNGTGTYSLTLGGAVGETAAGLALTKAGSGTLILTGDSTYTGGTTVSGGALRLNNTSGSGTGTGAVTVANTGRIGGNGSVSGAVTIKAGGGLAAGITDWTGAAGTGFEDLAVPALTIEAGAHSVAIDTRGLVNFTESPKTFPIINATGITGFPGGAWTITTTGFSGTGTWSIQQNGTSLELVYAPAGGGYASWASTNAPTGTPGEDFDGDGVSNAVEYVLGGTSLANDLAKLPQATISGGNMVFTFVRDQQSIDGSTVVRIETGTNLNDWPGSYEVPDAASISNPGVSVTKNSPAAGKDTVVLTLPVAPDARKFARLRVTVP